MKYHVIDNSLKNLGKTVLWQYDRAVRLLSVLKHMQVLYHCAVEQFWEFWATKVLAIETCGSFGCSIWGLFLGVPRPTIVENGRERLIVTSVYRRILKGAFYLMKASSSFKDILGYLEIVFGIGGEDNLSKWSVYVSEYGWTTNIEELNGETTSSSDTLLLKLYDPEGICRKIGGAPKNSLSISVSYEFGDTTITAVATRRRKCGVTLVDNGDMSMDYGKSMFYDEMHRDQKYIFEQRFDEFCPFPLGVRTNAPVSNWVFGLADENGNQSNVLYEANRAYSKGDIFGYEESNDECYNWKCLEDISAEENSSFESIKSKIEKTSDGGPFIDTLAEGTLPYITFRNCVWETVYHMVYRTAMATPIPPKTLVAGLDGNMTKIYQNTTDGYLIVCHCSEAEWTGSPLSDVANFKDWIYVDDPTEDNLMSAIATICKRNNCPVIGNSRALGFIPGVQYLEGMVVQTSKGERIVVKAGIWNDESDLIGNSVPQSRSCLHEFYPYKTVGAL